MTTAPFPDEDVIEAKEWLRSLPTPDNANEIAATIRRAIYEPVISLLASPEDERLADNEFENLSTVDAFMAAANSGDVERFTDVLTENCLMESVAWSGPLKGRKAAGRMLQLYIDAFAPKFEIEQEVARGDSVVLVYRVRGKHKGEFRGIPPTGNPISGRMVTISKLADGLIAKQSFVFDTAALLSQVGFAVPTWRVR